MDNSKATLLSLAEVTRRLNAIGIPWAVFAGAAAAAYGVNRPITDIDILVPVAAGAQAAQAFPEAEVERRIDGTVRVLKLPGYDILAGLNQSDLDRAMEQRLNHAVIEGVRVPLIPVEDNIVLKAQLGRGAAEGKRDWEDVEEMVQVVKTVDWEYLYWRLEQLESPERLARIVERLEAVRARLCPPASHHEN